MKASPPSRCIGEELEYTGHHLWTGRWNLWKPSLCISSTCRTSQVYRINTKLLCCTILQCSDSNLNGGSPHPLAVSVGQESRSSWNCVVLTQGLLWGCSQDVDWGCDSPLTPWQDAGYSSKMIPSHGCYQEIPVSCQLFEEDLSSSPCEALSRASQHGSWLPLEKLILERARRKL